MTLTYNPSLAAVKVDPHAKNQGQRSNSSNRRADRHTHTHTHGCYQTYHFPCYTVDNKRIDTYLEPAMDALESYST